MWRGVHRSERYEVLRQVVEMKRNESQCMHRYIGLDQLKLAPRSIGSANPAFSSVIQPHKIAIGEFL